MTFLCPAQHSNCCHSKEEGRCDYCGYDFGKEYLLSEDAEFAREQAVIIARQRMSDGEKNQQVQREAVLQAELAALKGQMAELLAQSARQGQEQDERNWRLACLEDSEDAYREYLNAALEGSRHIEQAFAQIAEKQKPKPKISAAGAVGGWGYEPLNVFRDTLEDGSLGPEMVVMPAGDFQMGSDKSEDEQPIHTVRIARPFALGKYPVTQKEWRQIMGDDPSYFKGCDNCPVEQVSWNDAQRFIEKLNLLSGKIYRLPSEAEWEYAAKAGRESNFAGGDIVDSVAWTERISGGKTQPVGRKQGNAWGLYDMSGNVWEWVEDRWNWNYAEAPADGSAWTSGEIWRRVLRGGSWYLYPEHARAASREHYSPTVRVNSIGFRLARMLP